MSYTFDTKALMAFFNGEAGAEKVEALLKEVDSGAAEGFISSVTLTEIYYLYFRRFGAKAAEDRIEQVKYSNLKIIAINDSIAINAGKYKAEKKIPIADALIAASALAAKSKVVTADEHFEGLGVKVVRFR
ncbi:MAG: PIN domain-containing protein [Euryarchaeota archaeon]|nr:PIN domain-containing protein [Euryarchaeota archaeon]